MRLSLVILAFTLSVSQSSASALAEDIKVAVQVFDQSGKPANKVRVSSFWRANGSGKSADGTPLDLSVPENLKIHWGNVGQMDANRAKDTGKDGTCQLELHPRSRVIYAMSEDRNLGGIGIVPPELSDQQTVEIHLAPVVTVKGRFRSTSPKQPVDWTHIYIELPPNAARPIAINRFISCGSFEQRFEFKVPPGQYRLRGYGVSDSEIDDIDLTATTTPTVKIDGQKKVVDIGWLELAPQISLDTQKTESKKSGRWRDYQQHYGQPAPNWHTSFSRDAKSKLNISDLRGKWVVIEFWGFSCAPCLRDHLPKLIKFAKANETAKDRLQLMSVCIDTSGEIQNNKQFEAALAQVEKHVWSGTKLNFPVVIDTTFKTWERYGLPGLGVLVLVDPEGRLVKGDLETLQTILNKTSK